jgi:hypothetical protein
MKKLFSRTFSSKPKERKTSQFLDVGFHGDKYLLEFTAHLLKDANLFIETGANVGTTLAYVARAYPHLRCISCEPDLPAFTEAITHVNDLSNVFLFNELSQRFIASLRPRFSDLLNGRAVFWLDAHSYGFEWPLREEVEFITSHFESADILIDDFLVPGMEIFKYDRHGDQVCSLDYIKSSMQTGRSYDVYYPAYTERTSSHHPLCGWGLISYGDRKLSNIPATLKDKVRIEKESL